MIDISGKTALITGGGRGIGKEIANVLAHAGANIAICDIDLETATRSAAELSSSTCKTLGLKADVSNGAEVASMVKSVIDFFGKIDILVNNAGITRDNLIIRMKDEDWDTVLSVNLKSAFLCSREVAAHMIKSRSGKIINIASVVGIMGNAGQANYSASKAGLIGLTKTLARELATRNITVNAVAPGFIQTAMTEKLTQQQREKLMTQIPMQRLGTPVDVANAVLFLASSLADYISGQVLVVDGGLVM